MSASLKCYKTIMNLRRTSSYLEKEAILQGMRNSPMFKRILLQTYSPYIRYHIRKIPPQFIGSGIGELDETTWTLLSKLSLRKLTGTAARESLFEHLESLCPAAERVLRLVVQKDLKCGIAATTINNTFPGLIPVFECQLVDDWDDSKARYPMMIGPKVDCVRGEFRSGEFFTRRGHKIVGVDHIIKYIESIGTHMELSGELYIPGMKFDRSSGIIRSNKPQKPNVKFAIFDIPSLGNMPYDQRHRYLSRTFYPLGTKPHPEAVYIPHIMAENAEQVHAAFKRWVAMGWEGLVGKNPSGRSLVGKGSYEWMRMVYGGSDEYKVINVYESDEVPGTLGGVIIEGNIKVGSGFTEDERVAYWRDPSIVLAKFATINYKERTKSGSLRQPIWKGIRFDI